MDHELEIWINDSKSWCAGGSGGIGSMPPMPKAWGRDIEELRRKILGPRKPAPVKPKASSKVNGNDLELLKRIINSKYHEGD
jgi:hypothetical protein